MARAQRGFAELVAMIIVAVLGLSYAVFEANKRSAQRQYARGEAAGVVFASWMHAAHRRAQEEEDVYTTALETDRGIGISIAGDLVGEGHAPAWLVRQTVLAQGIELGVIRDGPGGLCVPAPPPPAPPPPPCVPMAFAVASPSAGRALSFMEEEGFRAGASAGGVIGIEMLGTELGAEAFSAGRRAGIEDAIGRRLSAADLVAVADLSIVYDERVVYRRRQPGRAYLSEMRTDLAFVNDSGVREGGTVFGEELEIRRLPAPPEVASFVVGRSPSDPSMGNVVASADVTADAAAGSAAVEGVVVDGHQAGEFRVLDAGRWVVSTTLEAGSGRGSRELRGSRMAATATLAAGPLLAVGNELDATGTVNAQDVAASTAGTGNTVSGTVEGTSEVNGTSAAADELRVSGSLRVTTCYGCGL